MGLQPKGEADRPASREIKRFEKIEPLFSQSDMDKMKNKFIDKRMVDLYKSKMGAFDKESEKIVISEGFRLDSEFITTQVLETLPTGDIRFDMKCAVDKFGHRGIPRGKVIELSGAPETMKSARAYDILADIQADTRGAIINIYETESKANAKYIGAAGCNTSEIIITLPEYIEQVYYDMEHVMRNYVKDRNASTVAYAKKHSKKSMSQNDFDELVFRARMSYPILVFLYDSIGNHVSMEQWQKTKGNKTTKTPGKHAQAHAEGFRTIRNLLGNSMAVLIVINHTKNEMGGGGGGSWGAKKTTTYGGDSIKYMSDIRVEHRNGVGTNAPLTTMMKVTRNGEDVTIGKWLTAKFLKNSLMDSSQQKIENILFRYKKGVGFDMGVSYMLAMASAGMMKEPILKPGAKNEITTPSGEVITVSFAEFHKMLMEDVELRSSLRDKIEEHYNNNSALVRKDV